MIVMLLGMLFAFILMAVGFKNRTSYHSHLQKPPTPIQMPIATIKEEPKSRGV